MGTARAAAMFVCRTPLQTAFSTENISARGPGVAVLRLQRQLRVMCEGTCKKRNVEQARGTKRTREHQQGAEDRTSGRCDVFGVRALPFAGRAEHRPHRVAHPKPLHAWAGWGVAVEGARGERERTQACRRGKRARGGGEE